MIDKRFSPGPRPALISVSLACFLAAGCGSGGNVPASVPTAATPSFASTGSAITGSTLTVTISDATAGTTIYYTTDGTTPTTASKVYTGALALTGTTTVNAIAAETGYTTSAVAGMTYTFAAAPAAAPTFSVASGTYTSIQSVALSDTTAGATIYYTTDGTAPTTTSKVYSGPISVGTTTTINAFAVASGFSNSPVATATYTINLPAAAAPVFSPAAGTYTSIQTVTLSDATAGTTIYYTLDGSTPTTASKVYSGPLTVSSTTTINAIASGATGYNSSAVASAVFTINLPAAASPVFSPAAGTYTSIQTVTITDATAGVTIFYTLDGSTPTTASAKYTGAITVASTETINAIASGATGYNTSAVASGTFTINLPAAATPTFSPAAGTFTTAQSVTISDATAGATIYYTLDGSTPTTASAKYTGAITVSTTETINAIASGATGFNTSAVASATFTINQPLAATPVFSPAAGTYTSAQTVSITDATAGATIYYTLDGSTPTTSSSKYVAPLSLSSTTTVKAIAAGATGFNTSAVASALFTINLPVAATPVFSPAAGTYTSIQTVTITDATAGTAIYYTLDGSTPTTASTLYTGAITVASTETINALAVVTGYNNSTVASATFTINLPAAAAPVFSVVGGTYASAQTVTLTDATAGSTIYYTIDGSTPTAASTKYTGAIVVSTTETIKAVAIATGYTISPVSSATYTITPTTTQVGVVLSTHDQTNLMVTQASVSFGTNAATTNQIIVDDTQTYQTMDGFGASFTDSAAYLLEEVTPTSQLGSALSDLFTRTGAGIGLNFMRLPMGASDLARSVYTFDDLASGQTDPTLAKFSIAHDTSYVLPLVLAAKQINPSMKLMVNPWSPPGWMKTSGSAIGGTLLSTMYTPFAQYFVKYIQAYQAAGVSIDYVSLQNEPLLSPSNYPGMYMDTGTQTTVMRDYMLPAFTAAGITAKFFVYDHNWDNLNYPETVLADPTLLASPQVAGTAWHGYAGNSGVQNNMAYDYPTKGQWETEHSGGTFIGDQFTDDFLEITNVLRNYAKGYIKWSLALNEKLGPNLTQNTTQYGGCNTCTPVITVNSVTGAVTKPVEFYTLGHYSKYVLPGATRIYSSNGITVGTVAFLNPDGSHALIAFNNASSAQTFQVQWGVQSFSYSLPAYGAVTFFWSGTQSGTAPLIATNEIQASSTSLLVGCQTENTYDTTGSYDVGYVTNNGYGMYKSVAFGATALSKVTVRTASNGNGGTAEFHLDSVTGPLLGTVTLPVTGNYQTYTSVSAPVTGAVGTHDVYMVFHGSGGIANVNWFQFQ